MYQNCVVLTETAASVSGLNHSLIGRQEKQTTLWCCSREIFIFTHLLTPSLTERLLWNPNHSLSWSPAPSSVRSPLSIHHYLLFKTNIFHSSTSLLEILLNVTLEYKLSNPMCRFNDFNFGSGSYFNPPLSPLYNRMCKTVSCFWAPISSLLHDYAGLRSSCLCWQPL